AIGVGLFMGAGANIAKAGPSIILMYALAGVVTGAAGVLVKDGPVEDLTEAIRRVLTGETVVDPALSAPGPHAESR
ncbi:hypothetical protein ACWCPH_32010, partial [Streptomyces zhihengii]